MPFSRAVVGLLLFAVVLGSAWVPHVARASSLQHGFNGVNSVTGNMATWMNELSLLEPSWPVYLEHVYNSRNTLVGLTGQGWSSGLEWSLVDRRNGQVALTRPDGRRDVMTEVPGSVDMYSDSRSGTRAQRLSDGSWTAVNQLQGTYVLLQYDSTGRLSQLCAPYLSENLHFEYSDGAAPVRVSDDVGNAIAFEYTAAGQLMRAVTPQGRTATYTYTPDGLLASITDTTGRRRSFEYDSDHRLARIFGSDGQLLEEDRYDALGRAVEQRDAVGARRTIAYDGNTDLSRSMTIVDPRGHTSRLEYDDAFRLIAIIDERGARATYTYTDKERGAADSYTDRNGNVWRFDVDAVGRRTGVTDPAGGKAEFQYASNGRLAKSIDPAGASWTYDYDASGALTHVANSTGGSVSIERRDEGRTVELSDDKGAVASFTQDQRGRPVVAQTPDGEVRITYDDFGGPTQVTDSSGTSMFGYDGYGQLLTLDRPDGQLRFVYNSDGVISEMTDPSVGVVHFHYDPRLLLVSATTDDGRTINFDYDANRNRTVQTDSRGRTVRFSYDDRNAIAQVVDPNGDTWTMTYDANGNLLSSKDPRGRMARFGYTFRNELQTVVDQSGKTTRFEYDPGGHLLADPNTPGSVLDGPLGLAIRPNVSVVPDPFSGQARRVTGVGGHWESQADLHLDFGTDNSAQLPLERVLVPLRSLARLRFASGGALAGWQSDVAEPASLEGTLTLHLQTAVDLISEPWTSVSDVYNRLLKPVYEPAPPAIP